MKKIIALLLSLLILLGSLAGCADGHFRFKDDTSLTRGQWIEKLAATFGMDEYEKKEPYFSDVSSSDSIFTSVQSCYEWDILRDVSRKLKKNSGASLEFVITTAVYATGADFSSYEGKNDTEKALNFANANDIAPSGLNYNKWATGEQCQAILSAAQFVYLNQEVTPIDKVVINEGVQDQRETTNIVNLGENEYKVANIQPNVNDVLIAPGTKESPDGVAIKVTEIKDNGDGTYTIKTSTPEFHEVFEEIEYAGVAVPEFEDIIPSDGVTISQIGGSVEPVSYSANNKPTITNLSCSTNNPKATTLGLNQNTNAEVIPLGIGTSKKEALSFTASCNFTKGTISLNPQWGSQSIAIEQMLTSGGIASPNAGEWFEKKSVFPDKTLFGSDAYSNDEAIEAYKKGVITADELREALYGMDKSDSNFVQDQNKPYVNSQSGHEKIPNITNKFSGGYEIVGSISITDLYIVPTYKIKTAKAFGIDTKIPTGIESFSIETNYGAAVSLSVKGKLENELTVCSIPVSLGGVGTLTLELKLYAELNGEISVKASITNNTKAEYSSGKTKKTSTQDSSASAEAELEFEAGPQFSAKLTICFVPILNADISAAIKVKAGVGLELSSDWTETDDAFIIDRKTTFTYGVDGHIPIVKFSIGTDKSTLVNKLNIRYTWTIVGEEGSNAPITAVKFDILPEEEMILWEEHLELPKDEEKKEEDTSSEDDTSSDSDKIGSNMNISSYYIHLTVGESVMVDIDYPAGYDADDFKWTSADKSIVTVKNGELKAKGSGSTNIKAESKDGKYYANCAVYVGE